MKKITASLAFSRAWEIFKKNPLQHIGVFFFIVIILWLLGFLIMPDRSAMNSMSAQPSFVPLIAFIVIEIFATLFMFGYALDIIRNQYKGLGEVFSKYMKGSVFLYVIIFYVLYVLAVIAIFIPLVGLFYILHSKSFIFFGVIIGYLLALYLFIRMFFVVYLLLDGHDFVDAIQISWKKTKPYIGEIILFYIFSFVVSIIGYIALIIGIFAAIPVIYFAQAVFYNEAMADDAPQPEMPTSLE